MKDYISLHGPFDGFLAFSQVRSQYLHAPVLMSSLLNDCAACVQGTILASLLLSMKRSGQILQVGGHTL